MTGDRSQGQVVAYGEVHLERSEELRAVFEWNAAVLAGIRECGEVEPGPPDHAVSLAVLAFQEGNADRGHATGTFGAMDALESGGGAVHPIVAVVELQARVETITGLVQRGTAQQGFPGRRVVLEVWRATAKSWNSHRFIPEIALLVGEPAGEPELERIADR